ncbi:MAG TPA: hypothetical protein VGU25_10915 [Acidobacteriaceae bacterium]|nr:hypothetical protein [Acidobacteriaceae bacterium]
MKKMIQSKVIAWLRGFVWAAMIAGCAWAGAQTYLMQPPTGHYRVVALGAGEGIGEGLGVGQGEGAQSAAPLPKDDLFAGTEVFAKGASDITEITMDPDSLNLVDGRDEHRAHNMVLNVVRTYTYDKPGMYNMADVDAIRNKLNTGDWHCSVHVRDLKNGSGSDVCSKHRTDGMRETAIIEVEAKSLTFIHTIRKSGGPGSSDLGFFPMLPGLGPMTMLAMTNPEALADMQFGLHGLPMILNMEPNTFNVTPFANDQMIQLKTLKVRPMDPEQMEKLNKQMKDFEKDFYKDKDKDLTAPAAPPTPQAAPAPAPPQPPE